MDHKEWVSNNGMGKLRIYSDEMLCRFDKLGGSMAFRLENAMIEYEDYRTNQKTTIIAERCVVWEEKNQVYIQVSGRKVIHTEPIPKSRKIRVPSTDRRPIKVYNEFIG